MEIEAYDTYAQSEAGSKVHFDVMLPIGGNEPNAQDKAKEFVEKFLKPPTLSNSKAAGFVILKQPNQKLERGWCRKDIVLSLLKNVLIPTKKI